MPKHVFDAVGQTGMQVLDTMLAVLRKQRMDAMLPTRQQQMPSEYLDMLCCISMLLHADLQHVQGRLSQDGSRAVQTEAGLQCSCL